MPKFEIIFNKIVDCQDKDEALEIASDLEAEILSVDPRMNLLQVEEYEEDEK